MENPKRLFITGLVAVMATYVTFEAVPSLYGHRWVPLLTIGAYWGLFEWGLSGARKFFGKKNSN
jgi:hypothetical protein